MQRVELADRVYSIKCMVSFMVRALVALAQTTEGGPPSDDVVHGACLVLYEIEDKLKEIEKAI